MAKKIVIDQIGPDDPREDKELVAKVDAMMAPEIEVEEKKEKALKPKTSLSKKKIAVEVDSKPLPSLDIFTDTPGAPVLSQGQNSETEESPEKLQPDAATSYSGKKETGSQKDLQTVPDTSKEPEDQISVLISDVNRPEDYDDSETAKAIDDIVAHESDDVLAVEDQRLANQQSTANDYPTLHTHKLFWSFIAILCLLAIATVAFVLDPNLLNPFSKLHWSSIRRHL